MLHKVQHCSTSCNVVSKSCATPLKMQGYKIHTSSYSILYSMQWKYYRTFDLCSISCNVVSKSCAALFENPRVYNSYFKLYPIDILHDLWAGIRVLSLKEIAKFSNRFNYCI